MTIGRAALSLAVGWLCVIAPVQPANAGGRPGQAPRDNPAVAQLRKAAELGDADAQFNLAVLYDTGRGVQQDYVRAALWYRRAADKGHVVAQYNLGNMYAAGQGVPRDDRQAVGWYRRSAEAGYAPAQFNLASMYEVGRGIDHDDAMALRWYRQAANQRYAPAMYNLAAMYFRGQGVPEDYVEAYKWRRLSVQYARPEKEHEYQASLDALVALLTSEQRMEAEARVAQWAPPADSAATPKTTDDSARQSNPADVTPEPVKQVPAFRSAVDLVEVEATVVEPDGAPITTLSANDFQLFVDGRARPITSVVYVSEITHGSIAASVDNAPRRSSAGRLIVFAVDQGSIDAGEGRGIIEAAQQFIDELLPADRVALVSFPAGTVVDFTHDHANIRAALDHAVGRAPAARQEFSISLAELFAFGPGGGPDDRVTQQRVIARECPSERPECVEELRAEAETRLTNLVQRADSTTRVLSGLFRTLAKVQGPKTLVLVAQGLALNPNGGDRVRLQQLATDAAVARVAVYSIGITADSLDAGNARPSPSSAQDETLVEAGLRELTDRTGGLYLRVTTRADAAFARIARELSGHYLIAFAVDAADRDGRAHMIRVSLQQPNATVRARSEFVIQKP